MLNMALLPMAINGCATPKPTPEKMQAGAVWMFPGIFGDDWSLAEARRGFRSVMWRRPFTRSIGIV